MSREDDARLANETIEPFIEAFNAPIIEWLAKRTGDDRGDLGTYIFVEGAAIMAAYMVSGIRDKLERRAQGAELVEHFARSVARVLAGMELGQVPSTH